MSVISPNLGYVRVKFAGEAEGDQTHTQHQYELEEEYELISDQHNHWWSVSSDGGKTKSYMPKHHVIKISKPVCPVRPTSNLSPRKVAVPQKPTGV